RCAGEEAESSPLVPDVGDMEEVFRYRDRVEQLHAAINGDLGDLVNGYANNCNNGKQGVSRFHGLIPCIRGTLSSLASSGGMMVARLRPLFFDAYRPRSARSTNSSQLS